VQKEGIHYNDLVEKYVHSDHVHSAPPNNSSPEEDTNAKPDNSKRGDPNDPRVRLKRDCVGLLAAFKLSDPSDHILVVANTHIYWQVKQSEISTLWKMLS
jgi:CCR4-NOT transcription complex subunit 6